MNLQQESSPMEISKFYQQGHLNSFITYQNIIKSFNTILGQIYKLLQHQILLGFVGTTEKEDDDVTLRSF